MCPKLNIYIKTGRMEHQDTKLTSMRPRLKELNDNPYFKGKEGTGVIFENYNRNDIISIVE